MTIQIITCACKSPFQDKLYGASKRVANSCQKEAGKPTGYRCTVCGRKHDVSVVDKPANA